MKEVIGGRLSSGLALESLVRRLVELRRSPKFSPKNVVDGIIRKAKSSLRAAQN